MSVYDKELIIDGKAVRSPEQQVYKNMKDIKDLQEIIKSEYTTSETLTSSSVSVAIADTNAPEGTTEGWLITQDGLKFKITGGDDTNLLLEFYANLQGPQGIPGAEVQIDDSGTSATKVWSSQKVATELASAGKQLYQHRIDFYNDNLICHLDIFNDSPTAFTKLTFKQYLSNHVGRFCANGYKGLGSTVQMSINFIRILSSEINISGFGSAWTWGNNENIETEFFGDSTNFSDTVITL